MILITRKVANEVLFIEWTSSDLRSWWKWGTNSRRAERFGSTSELRFRDAYSFALRDGPAFPVDEGLFS